MHASHRTLAAAIAALLGLAATPAGAASFVYAGRLDDRGAPASGRYDIRLTPYPHDSRGSTLAAPMVFEDVDVRDGRFRLDFDLPLAGADGAWLELGVRDAGAAHDFASIPGRAKATAAPLVGACWSTTGDAGINPATNFIGSTDNQPFIVRSSNVERGRFDANGLRVNGPTFQPQIEFAVRANTLSQYSNILLEAGGMQNQRSGILISAGDGADGQNNHALYIDQYQDEGQQPPSQTRRMELASDGAGRFAGTGLVASGGNAVALGGTANTASGSHAGALAGINNTASGFWSTVPGGGSNCAGGDFSFAGGQRAKVRVGNAVGAPGVGCAGVPSSGTLAGDVGTFVWADTQSADFVSTGPDQFNVRAAGGVNLHQSTSLSFGSRTRQMVNLWGPTAYGIGVQADTLYMRSNNFYAWYQGGVHADAALTPGAGGNLMMALTPGPGITTPTGYVRATLFSSVSDRNVKTGFSAIDPLDVLGKVLALPLSRWSYRSATDQWHIGPMAQDFFAAFGLGGDDKTISTVDADGVALAAIQGLNAKLERENAALRGELAALRTELRALAQDRAR